MSALSLVRSQADRNRYDLAGVGHLHVAGVFGGDRAMIVTNGGVWTCGKAAIFGGALTATGSSDAVDGRFEPAFLGGGGTLEWGRAAYMMRPTGLLSTGYRLQREGTPLWEFKLHVRLGGARPMDVTRLRTDVPDEVVMFAVYIARTLARRKSRKRSGVWSGSSPSGGG